MVAKSLPVAEMRQADLAVLVSKTGVIVSKFPEIPTELNDLDLFYSTFKNPGTFVFQNHNTGGYASSQTN
jgi:hypothetical protein